jgi:hypothetical protein
MNEELQNLYKVLFDEGLYSKSYDEFLGQWQDDAYKTKVYGIVIEKGLYSKDEPSFYEKYSLKKKEQTGIPFIGEETVSMASKLPSDGGQEVIPSFLGRTQVSLSPEILPPSPEGKPKRQPLVLDESAKRQIQENERREVQRKMDEERRLERIKDNTIAEIVKDNLELGFTELANNLAQVSAVFSGPTLPAGVSIPEEYKQKPLTPEQRDELQSRVAEKAKADIASIQEESRQFDKGFLEYLADLNFEDAFKLGLATTVRSAPYMTFSAVLPTGGALAAIGTVSAGQAYNEFSGEDWFEQLSPAEKAGFIGAYGGFEAGGEYFGTRVIKRAGKTFLKGLLGKEGFENTAKEFIGGALKAYGANVTEEGLGEAVTGFGQSITRQAAEKGIDNIDWEQALDETLESAALGAFGGGLITTASLTPNAIAVASSTGKNSEKIVRRDKIDKLKKEYDAAESLPYKKLVGEQLDIAVKEDAAQTKSDVQFYKEIGESSPTDLKELNRLDVEIRSKINQITAAPEGDIRDAGKIQLRDLIVAKREIENKYDRKEKVGVPSPVVEGEAAVEAQPVEAPSPEAPEAGRILQVPEEEVTAEIYQEFVDTGNVPDGAIVSISNKIVSGETLTEQEQAIYKDKSGQIEEQIRLRREQFMTPEEIQAEEMRAEKEAPKVEAVKPEDLPVESTSREFIKVVEEQLPTPTEGKFGGYPIMTEGYKKGDQLVYEPISKGGNVLAEVGLQAVSPDVIEVSEFASVPTMLGEKRSGAGTKALKQLTKFADDAGVTLRLTPSPIKTMAPVEGIDTQEALIKFYEEKGGFELREDGFMYYEPKKAVKAAPKKAKAVEKKAPKKAPKAVTGAPKYATNKVQLEKILEAQPNITKEQAKATASVMDVMIGKMAERSNISKAEMYDKIGFVKGELPEDKMKMALMQDPNSGYYSNVQEALQKIDTNRKATPKEWVSLLEKTGIPAVQQQLNNIGFLEFFESYVQQEGLKTVPYQDVKDYIDMYDFDMYEEYTDKYATGYQPKLGLEKIFEETTSPSISMRYNFLYDIEEERHKYTIEPISLGLSGDAMKKEFNKIFESFYLRAANKENYKKQTQDPEAKTFRDLRDYVFDFLLNPNDPIVIEASEATIGGYTALKNAFTQEYLDYLKINAPIDVKTGVANFSISSEAVEILNALEKEIILNKDFLKESGLTLLNEANREFGLNFILDWSSTTPERFKRALDLMSGSINMFSSKIEEVIKSFKGKFENDPIEYLNEIELEQDAFVQFMNDLNDVIEDKLKSIVSNTLSEWGNTAGRTILFKSPLLTEEVQTEKYTPPHFGYDDILHVRMFDVNMVGPESAALDSENNVLDGRGVVLTEVQSDLLQFSKKELGDTPEVIKKNIDQFKKDGIYKYISNKKVVDEFQSVFDVTNAMSNVLLEYFDNDLNSLTEYVEYKIKVLKERRKALVDAVKDYSNKLAALSEEQVELGFDDALESKIKKVNQILERTIVPLINKLTNVSVESETAQEAAENFIKSYIEVASSALDRNPHAFKEIVEGYISGYINNSSLRWFDSGMGDIIGYGGSRGFPSGLEDLSILHFNTTMHALQIGAFEGSKFDNYTEAVRRSDEAHKVRNELISKYSKGLRVPEAERVVMPFKKTEQPLRIGIRRALKDVASKQALFPDQKMYLILPSGKDVADAVAGGILSKPQLASYYETTVPAVMKEVVRKIDKDAQLKDGKTVSLQFGQADPQNKITDFKYIEITPKIVEAFVNKPIALFQDYNGAMVEDNAKYLIYLMENANVSTPLHEMAHVYEKFLTDEEKAQTLKWAGHKQWSKDTSEKFARGFERYLAEGRAPQLWLQRIFNKFKQWMMDIYAGLTGSKIDLELSPEMTKIYDSIFLQYKTFEFRRPTQLQGTMDLWIERLQQKFIGVLRLQEQVENSIGKAVAIGQDFRNAFRLVNGKIADKFDKLKEKYEETALSMKKLRVSQEDLHLFLYANTAAERNAFVKENRDPMNSSGSGMTDADAERILNEFKEKNLTDKLKESAKSIYDITKDTRKKLVEYGLESQETIDKYEQNFKNYVPLRGFETTGEEDFESIPGFSQRQVKGKRKLFKKKIKGRTTLAGNIVYQVIADNYETIVRGEKNLMLQRLYKFAEEYRDNDVWETLTPKQVGSKKPTKFEAIPVFFNGEAHYIKMRDQNMNEIINESSYESASKILTFFSAINRFASMMFTTYSPGFWVTNFVRDLEAAVFNVLAEQEIEDGLLVGKKILKGIVKESILSLRTIFAVETTGKSKLKETAKYYEEFKEDGAPTAWIENLHPDKIKNAFDQIAELSDAGTASLMNKKQLSVAANKVSEYVLSVNSAFENAIRLAVYVKSRKAGVSREKAAELGKTITLDFNASGTWGRGFNATYLFFNAATQNVARLVRTLGTLKTVVDPVTGKKKKTATTAQKLAFGVIGFGYLMTQLNIAFSGDDEDELEKYMDVPDYEKTRNIIFYPPKAFRKYLMSLNEEEGYIKIPTTYGYNMFFNFGVAMAELENGQRSPASAAAFAFNSFIDGILPIQVQTSDKSTLTGFAKTFAPSATKPFLEVLTNEAYNGSPVYREGFPTDKTPRSYKGFERSFTEKSMSEITKTLNDISGGSEYVSGGIDWNPDATIYILNYFGGGPLSFAEKTVNSVDIAYKKAMGESQDVNPNNIPILRRFLGSTNPYGDYATYYERKEEITSLFKEMSDPKVKKDDPDRYKSVDELYITLYGVSGTTGHIGIDDEIKKMFESKRKLNDSLSTPNADPILISESVEKVELNIGKAVDKFNARYNKLRGVK